MNKNKKPMFICWAWGGYEKRKLNYSNEINVPWHFIKPDYETNRKVLEKHLIKVYNSPEIIEKQGVFSSISVIPELAIPLAAYMGFKKIYLIGVDFTNSTGTHFYKDHEDDKKILTKQIKEKCNDGETIHDIKLFSMEIISQTKLHDAVFNLNPHNAIKTMKLEDIKNL